MNIEILRQFRPQLIEIAQKHGISKLSVFGSIARGEATQLSDVDFLVEMQPNASLFGAAGFSYEAEKLLNTRVDIIPASTLDDLNDREFVSRIQHDAVPL